MRAIVACSAVVLAALISVPAAGEPVLEGPSRTAADAGTLPPLPACLQVTSTSRYVPFGYNHVVIVKNGCSRAASCTVTTDVNPELQRVDVAASATVEVLTFMGAAASTFNARVGCELR